ncbi:MAG: thioredoxin family protein [Bacteroidales bacterium]|nr:thioredoxin family protein [Bacteroidales bacterium]
MKKLITLILSLLLTICSFGQIADWNITYNPIGTTKDTFQLVMEISIPDEFHMYSFDQASGGPIAASVSFNIPDGIKKIGGLQILSEQPETFFDDIFEVQIRQFSKKTKWAQKFVITQTIPNSEISGNYSYQLCKDDGYCLNPLPENFTISIPAHSINKASVPTSEPTKPIEANNHIDSAFTEPLVDTVTPIDNLPKPIEQAANETEQEARPFWLIFLLGFLGGILAFLTPCVFPMVPMTVSMFLRRDKQHALRDVLIYGASIVAIFVFLGLCITMLFGVDALNKLSTSPIFNMVFFFIFIIFAISFFGVFELMLPSSWINYMDQKADSSHGFVSIFFMAFTLVLVSFSCTAMIIGTLLVESVVSGSIIGPLVGMLGFAIALALPFIIFAAVPSLLSSLAKSGDWMNDIKISLGFIELAFALKFISKADLVAGWNMLSRDVFIAIWIILLILWGLCILRVIRLGHTQKKALSKTRIAVATIIFLFATYLIPGFLGKPIDLISGYLPPMTTQKIHVLSENNNTDAIQSQKKYGTIFHTPYGIEAFYDYDEGMAYAKSVNKPVLLDFTGLGCENCRKIEMNVWAKPEILTLLKEKYVLISLYLDSREPLDSSLVRVEQYGDKSYEIKTVGEHWSIFMMKNYHGLMQPYYVLLSPEGEKLAEPITYNEAKNLETYKSFLLKGLERMKK